MPKRGQTSIDIKDLQLPEDYKQALTEKEQVVKTYAPAIINTSVKLQSLLDARLSYTGQVTGKSYYWNRAGSVQVVDASDAPSLMEKRIKTQSCCNQSDNAVFQRID